MTQYKVTWTDIIEAEDVNDAVRQADGMLQDPDNICTFWRVENLETEVEVFCDFASILIPRFPEDLSEDDENDRI